MNVNRKIIVTTMAALGFVLLLSTVVVNNFNIYGQMIGNTTQSNQTNSAFSNQTASSNQTTPSNQTANAQQAQQQIQQADKQIQQAQQQKQQAQQQLQKSQTKNATALSEKMLNFTNAAITALNNNDEDAAKQTLTQMQSYLINATGKHVVVIPSTAIPSSSDSKDKSD